MLYFNPKKIIHLNYFLMDHIIESIIKKKDYIVSRFHQTNDEYILSGKDGSTEFHLSKELYNGKMPPNFRWPWQKLNLTIFQIDDFVVSAVLDGCKLFEISEEDFPEEIKRRIQKMRTWLNEFHQQALEAEKARDEELKQKLQVYISNFPVNKSLEEEASSLPLCLRTYFKLHLLKGKSIENRCFRLSLMFEILKVVDLWYRRYKRGGTFGVAQSSFRFIHIPLDGLDNIEAYKKVAPQEYQHLFHDYDEVREIISERFPPIDDYMVRDYLIRTVQKIAKDYSSDCLTLEVNQVKDAWGHRINSDEEDYRRSYKNMKMLSHSNFILPENFDEEQKECFFSRYSLE